jgi:hypothetical protein
METKTVKRSDERMDSFERDPLQVSFLNRFFVVLMASLGKFLIAPQSSTNQNFWKEAVTQTNSLVPYLFMRV